MSEIPSSVRNNSFAFRPGGDASARLTPPPDATPSPNPILPEQPTVISKSPPGTPPVVSDSACRILEGRILPGDHLGHFELIEYVGGGGMGRVFRATDTRLARSVALKILPPDQAADPEVLQRFQNEAQSAARLDHENIARVHYVGEDRGIHFIAFEFVEGVNIRVLMERKGVLPLNEAVNYVLQVAEALSHSDSRHVVHRDIKPSNVLITPEGRVKLIDMGLARLRQLDADAAELTASGVTLGTFDYISPEQARDPRVADIRSDIYSLGCTFFFMLAGRPPFPEGTVLQKLLQHQSEQPPDVRQFRPDVPEEIVPVLQRMLAKEPENRYSHPAELVADLTAVAERLGLHPLPPLGRIWVVPPEQKTSRWHRHIPWLAATAALALIVLLLNSLWKSGTPSTSLPAFPGSRSAQSVSESVAPRVKSSAQPPAGSAPLPTKPGESPPTTPESYPVAPRNDDFAPAFPAATWSNSLPGSPLVPSSRSNPFAPDVSPYGGFPQPEPIPLTENGTGPAPPPVFWGPRRLRSLWEDGALPSPLPFSRSGPGGDVFPPGSALPRNGYRPLGEIPAARSDVLIVGDGPDGPNRFSTLQAACAAARSGDAIELCFDGRREQSPLRIGNLNLTIRSGEGYRPILVFRPDDGDPVQFPHSMFSLCGGRLTLSALVVEFEVPRDIPADRWSLMEIRGGQTVRVEQSVLTVRNASEQNRAYHPDVTFFRIQPPWAAESTVEPSSPSAIPLATLELADVIARGEAVLLAVDHLQPTHLIWENGLLATTECLVAAGGGAETPKTEANLQIDLRHVTADVRQGLCRLTASPDEPYVFPVQFNSLDNIFLTLPGAPLLKQTGLAAPEDCRRQIIWNGNRNFYEQTDVLWRIEPRSAEDNAEILGAAAWQKHWGPSRENQPRFGQTVWKQLPPTNRPISSYLPADFALSDATAGNPALGAAGDGRNAGLIPERLPAVPLDPPSPPSSPLPVKLQSVSPGNWYKQPAHNERSPLPNRQSRFSAAPKTPAPLLGPPLATSRASKYGKMHPHRAISSVG